jgi:hypothetical protein
MLAGRTKATMFEKFLKRMRGPRPEEELPDDPPTAIVDPRVSDMQRNRIQGKDKKIVGGGFDPYNSGAFKRQDAWERVNRK